MKYIGKCYEMYFICCQDFISLQFHFYFISTQPFILLCSQLYFIPFSFSFLSYPGIYFISAWSYLSLLAYGNICCISFLLGTIYHSLPRTIFLVFHFFLGLFNIPCLGQYFGISFLPRVISLVA